MSRFSSSIVLLAGMAMASPAIVTAQGPAPLPSPLAATSEAVA